MHRSAKSKTQAALDLVREHGIARPKDLVSHKIPPDYLDRLYRRGQIQRIARGLYVWPDADLGENQSLIEAARQVPKGVICLLSALRFHGITTQAPYEVWIAVPPKAWLPKVSHPKLRVFRFSPQALTKDVKEHSIQGVPVRITTPARTVVDCFAFRNKVGLDVALEALRDCWRQKKATMDELHQAAQSRRMANVMRPYMESLT
jgi:predicted transcriptional regulator of viral defense system